MDRIGEWVETIGEHRQSIAEIYEAADAEFDDSDSRLERVKAERRHGITEAERLRRLAEVLARGGAR